MFRLFLFISLFLLSACLSQNKIKESNIEFIIQESQSYKYDLQQQIFTVYNMNGDTTIHFHISEKEKQQIINQYYNLGLENINNNIKIEDYCLSMPKFYTTLKVKSRFQQYDIIIDEECSDYKNSYKNDANHIKEFLQYIKRLLKKKIEIENAPSSDIMYF